MCARRPTPVEPRPSREQAEAAVRTLIAYVGDNPDREGLLDTPKRVVDAYEELYRGYRECPAEVLDRTFSETGGYDDLVLVRDIPLQLALRAPHDAVLPARRMSPICRSTGWSACRSSRAWSTSMRGACRRRST